MPRIRYICSRVRTLGLRGRVQRGLTRKTMVVMLFAVICVVTRVLFFRGLESRYLILSLARRRRCRLAAFAVTRRQ